MHGAFIRLARELKVIIEAIEIEIDEAMKKKKKRCKIKKLWNGLKRVKELKTEASFVPNLLV